MNNKLRRLLLSVAVALALCLSTTDAARASVGYASDSKAAGVIAAVVAVGVLIGVGVYFAVHHGHSLSGCAATGPGGGIELLNEGDHQAYLLTGDASGIQSGHRVHVSGNKGRDAASGRTFAVSKLSKDYGACTARP